MRYAYLQLVYLTQAFENPYTAEEYQVDTKLALHSFEVLRNVISIVLGILVIILSCLIAVTTVTDILFLTVPSVHEYLGEMIDKFRREGKHSKKIVIMSKQAVDAWEEAVESGKNVYIIYLRKRAGFYIAVSVVVFFMVTGWSQVVGLVAKVIYRILQALNLM